MSTLLDNKEQTTVRIASVRGKGIRKRCRKEERIYVQAVGATNQEALERLKIKLTKEVQAFREIRFSSEVHINDGWLKSYGGGSAILSQPIIMSWENPGEYNFVAVPFESIGGVAA